MQRVCTFTEPVGTVKFIHNAFLYYYSTYLTEKVNGTWLSDDLETFRSPRFSKYIIFMIDMIEIRILLGLHTFFKI